jgi:hypothetical protein
MRWQLARVLAPKLVLTWVFSRWCVEIVVMGSAIPFKLDIEDILCKGKSAVFRSQRLF